MPPLAAARHIRSRGFLTCIATVVATTMLAACAAPTTPAAVDPYEPPVLATPTESPTPAPSAEPTPDPSVIAAQRAHEADVADWVDAINDFDEPNAAALEDVLSAYDGGTWSEREAAVAYWEEVLSDAPDEPGASRGCWADLAEAYADEYARQADVANTLGLVIEDHNAGFSESKPFPGQLTSRQQLQAVARDYREEMAGNLRADAVLSVCEVGDGVPVPPVPAPIDGTLVNGLRIGEPSMAGGMILSRIENPTGIDQLVKATPRYLNARGKSMKVDLMMPMVGVVPAHGTSLAWTLPPPAIMGGLPKGWKRIAVTAEVTPYTKPTPRGELSSPGLIRTSVGDFAGVTVTNSAVEGWCGAVTAVGTDGEKFTASGAQDMQCPKVGGSWRELVHLSGWVAEPANLMLDLRTTGENG